MRFEAENPASLQPRSNVPIGTLGRFLHVKLDIGLTRCRRNYLAG